MIGAHNLAAGKFSGQPRISAVHPCAGGLKICAVPFGNVFVNLVNGEVAVNNNACTQVGGRNGRAIKFTGTQYQTLSLSGFGATPIFSALGVFKWDGTTANSFQGLFSIERNMTMYCPFTTNATLAVDSLAGGTNTIYADNAVLANVWKPYGITSLGSGALVSGFIDGVVDTAHDTNYNYTTAANPIIYIGDGQGGETVQGVLELFLMWDRCLPYEAMRVISNNPFGILASYEPKYWASILQVTSAGGGGVLNSFRRDSFSGGMQTLTGGMRG